MRAQILNEIGNVVNTVVADVAYLDAKYPGHWREEILFDEDGNPSPPSGRGGGASRSPHAPSLHSPLHDARAHRNAGQ